MGSWCCGRVFDCTVQCSLPDPSGTVYWTAANARADGFSANVFYALAAYRAGVLSDNADRVTVLGLGFGILVAADLVLALTNGIVGVAVGVGLWGLHMGFTQGLLATLIADTAPPELRGTAYGVFNLLVDLALLVASVLAGALWDVIGPRATFLTGAAFTVFALVCLPTTRRIAPHVGRALKSS